MSSFTRSVGQLQNLVAGILLLSLGCGGTPPSPRPVAELPTSKADVVTPQPEPGITSAELNDQLVLVNTGSPIARCHALNRLGSYWSVKRVRPTGFSDLPIEVKQPNLELTPMAEVEAIAMVLPSALIHESEAVRNAAASCLCRAPVQCPGVDAAVAVALNSRDRTVLWYLQQLKIQGYQWPDPEPFVHNLIEHLKLKDPYAATDLIQKFGEKFTPHTYTVVENLSEIPQQNRWLVFLTLANVGLSSEAADLLMTRVDDESLEAKSSAFVALLKFPSMAAQFLRQHRGIGMHLEALQIRVGEALVSHSSDLEPLRQELIATPDIGPVILALVGSSKAIPELTRQLEAADEHRKALIRACLRACGGELGVVVHLSKEKPVDFKPRSAWPGHDSRRTSNKAGHGDGMAVIIVTGEIKCADGSHPAEIRFFRTNDEMLMGEGCHDAIPLKYDQATGRFVLLTTVFAAYAMGSPIEPGPYQTGSAQVQIEATGCRPLKLQFFDEMPHVEIVLSD